MAVGVGALLGVPLHTCPHFNRTIWWLLCKGGLASQFVCLMWFCFEGPKGLMCLSLWTVGQWDCGRDPKLWGWVRGLVGGCCWWWWWVSSRFVFWASWKLQPRCFFTSFFPRHFITTLPFPFSGFVQKRREWGLGGEKWATEFVHGCLLLST